MPKPIQNPRVGQALAREFGLVGRVHPSLDEVVVPVVLAGDVRSVAAPVTREGTVARREAAGGVGNFAFFRLETPAGTLARIRLIAARPAVAGTFLFHWGSTIAAPANLQDALTFTDGRRRRAGGLPGVRLASGLVAALPAAAVQHWRCNVSAFQTDALLLPPSTIGQPDSEDFLEIWFDQDDEAMGLAVWFEEFPYQTSLAG